MKFTEVQDAILARLKATDLPNVWEGDVPAGFILPRMGGQTGPFLPYGVVNFGGKSPMSLPRQGIVGSAEDVKWTSVAVEVCGYSARDVRIASDVVRESLEGYVPDISWGELTERLAGDYQVLKPEYELWPVRHATGIVFGAVANAERPVMA